MSTIDPDDLAIIISGPGNAHIASHPEDRALLVGAATSFREFLNHWWFLDQDTGVIRCLGAELWPAQEEFVKEAESKSWVFYLKARQLGETTIACAFDAWVLRFRDGAVNQRVHVFSKREKEAQSLLSRVKFGLERLPEYMRLPTGLNNLNEYELVAGPNDRRLCVAYPADNDTARGETCGHAHLDEWAFMGSPRRVWQAIEPSAAGTVHFVTTGQGPANFTSAFWRKCLAGDAKARDGSAIAPCFIGALERPDRTQAWLKAKRAGMDEQAFLQEYPQKWEDALSGGGEYVFKSSDIDAAGVDYRGFGLAIPGRKYVKAWDIGRHQDAAVGIVLDVTDDVHDVVHYRRLRGVSYPDIQMQIEITHAAYPGLTVVEKNSAGEAVLENLNIPEHERVGFSTTGASKPRILAGLTVSLQNWLLKWNPNECEQLDVEVRGYQLPDDNVVQDSVITLAIAEEHAGLAHTRAGKLGKVMHV
jgi:hypothetical protein